MLDTRRRHFITLLGGAAAAWPLAARAQGKLPTIGFLGADASSWSPWTAAFVERMRKLGWIEGRTIAIEYRWDEGRPERSVRCLQVLKAVPRGYLADAITLPASPSPQNPGTT